MYNAYVYIYIYIYTHTASMLLCVYKQTYTYILQLRNPLNGVIGNISLLEECELESSEQELVHTTLQCSTQLMRIMNDVLDLSKVLRAYMYHVQTCLQGFLCVCMCVNVLRMCVCMYVCMYVCVFHAHLQAGHGS
jgi:signal transduction histidine kinase